METKKIAWNDILNNQFLGAWDIPENGTLIVKIIKAQEEEVENFQTYKKEKKFILTLDKHKPMVCNITNAKSISKALKSKFIQDWEEKYIELEVKMVKVGKEWKDGIRVKDQAPKAPTKEELTPTHAKWTGAIDSLISGKVTIEQIEAKYTLSTTNKQLLCSNSK